MSITKSTGRENLTKNAFWLGPGRPTDNENQVKMYTSTVLGTLPFKTLRIWIRFRIKQLDPDPDQIEKQNPDPYQRETQDPDPYQNGLDPQLCSKVQLTLSQESPEI
jgi:hypothetical protein